MGRKTNSLHPMSGCSLVRLSLLWLFAFFLAGACGCASTFRPEAEPPPVARPLPSSVRSVRIVAVGDIMAHAPVTNAARIAGDQYDFAPFFTYMFPLFAQADMLVGNLETPLAGKAARYSGYPAFNAPDALAIALKDAGFDLLHVANNHTLDRGWKGLERTLETLTSLNMDYVGAYQSPADRSRRILRSVNGIRLAVLGYTYGLNGRKGPPRGEEWRLSLLDAERIKADMAEARNAGAELVVLSLHWGTEYQRMPSKKDRAFMQTLLQSGADVIIGHHPHVVQPFEVFTSAAGDKGVAYSLGNFLSNQSYPHTDVGAVLDCEVRLEEGGRVRFNHFRMIPTLCHKRVVQGRKSYRVLPMHQAVLEPESFGLTSGQARALKPKLSAMEKHINILAGTRKP